MKTLFDKRENKYLVSDNEIKNTREIIENKTNSHEETKWDPGSVCARQVTVRFWFSTGPHG